MLFSQRNYRLIQNCRTFVLALQLDRFKGFCLPYLHPRSNCLLFLLSSQKNNTHTQNTKTQKIPNYKRKAPNHTSKNL